MKKKHIKAAAAVLAAVLVLVPQSVLAAKTEEQIILQEKTDLYQAAAPEYRFDNNARVQKPSSVSVRFEQKEDGTFHNPDAEETGEATLMITGDLMCQYRQQEAAFTSNGKDYIGHEDMQKIKAAALEKQEDAKENILLGNPFPAEDEESMESGSGEEDEVEPADSGAEAEDTVSSAVSAVPGTSVSIPALDFGTVPQPEGTWNFNKSFRHVRKILKQGDLVIGNLETMLSQSSPLTMQCRRLEDKPYLNSPVEFLDAVDYAGYDLLTLANNHNCDVGVQGLLETLDNIDSYGFMRTGMFAGEEEDRYVIVDVNGIKVGIVAYATYFNKKEDNFTEEGQNVLLNSFDIDKARVDIKAAKKAGAEFVIAFMHWGKENTHDTTAKQRRYARYVARAGADYIVGSHPHALQPYEIIELSNGRQIPVIYSMGNFLSCMQQDINYDTVVLQLKLKRNEEGKIAVTSHRLYPCTIMEDLDTVSSDGTVSSESYVITPHLKEYMPQISDKSYSDRLDLEFFAGSFDRIVSVFGNEMLLDVPYDLYGLEGGIGDSIDSEYILNRAEWILDNQL